MGKCQIKLNSHCQKCGISAKEHKKCKRCEIFLHKNKNHCNECRDFIQKYGE